MFYKLPKTDIIMGEIILNKKKERNTGCNTETKKNE